MKYLTVVLFIGMLLPSIALADSKNLDHSIKLSKQTKSKVKSAIDRGVRFLRYSQNKEGHWGHPGITALILYSFFLSPRKYGPEDGPWVRKPIEYIINLQKENGGIYTNQLANYTTSISLMALTGNPDVAKQHEKVIEKAQKFLVDLQCDEGEGYDPTKDPLYGGIGYGGDERPDLSNTQYALEALHDSGLSKDHQVYKKALIFLQRCQNRTESNDQKGWVANDGGFVYYPANSPAGADATQTGKKYRSYGSMTYAGIKSYIYASVDKNDPRVQSAYKWISRNYDLSENPGAGKQGLFYYYHTFAKTMSVYNQNVITDDKNVDHNWREDLATILLNSQKEDGSWVNEEDRWWEADPRLVTAYAVLALSICYK
ncbi:prenyltransferase/squalene oxidase repeat-containing protein [Candidatus Uabimicrobium sp. HlEnr_7]|uniref:prenyltransferase/squalene oxidase repeat-containing protein n=1 Tax=Candidatus Uabimicrobium helgolandensis TaxID=3095367 RepID=UPI00355656EA